MGRRPDRRQSDNGEKRMKCIQVNLNGKPCWTIGHEEVADLVFRLTYAPSVEAAHMSASGLFPNAQSVDKSNPWEQAFIKMDDVITLQVIESVMPNVTATLIQDMAKAENGEGDLHCSFCGKGQNAVSKLITGKSALICNECVDHCVDIVHS